MKQYSGRTIRYLTPVLLICLLIGTWTTSYALQNQSVQPAANGDYQYKSITDDPLDVRVYTLDNGLKVYLSKNEEKPTIQTYIAIRAGAQNDPHEATGLAHYLEHIMFKGTSDFGTLNWKKEKVLLDSLETMFEHYRTLTNGQKREAYYAKIDEVSQQAAEYAIPNEYDKMIGKLGGRGTNAFTNYDETVYVNNIPANQIENWLKIESDRFSEIVPRLFHTELEAVYEEKNRMTDGRKAYQTMMSGMFANHPYGTHTVIGTIDHLKNPSMKEIEAYFDTYYVPNNAAIIMAGDLDYERTIKMVDKHFGSWKASSTVPEINFENEQPIEEPIVKEVTGPSSPYVNVGFRFPARNSEDYLKARMVNMILSSEVGLLNLNLNQKQKVQSAGSYLNSMKDYSMHAFYGSPKKGQSLKEVVTLMLDQLELIKQGKFEDWLPDALIADMKKSEMGRMNSNGYRASQMLDAFTNEMTREQQLKAIDFMENLTKEEISEFVRQNYQDNYVVVYKREGELDVPQVDKPEITKIKLNKEVKSDFHNDILDNEVDPIEPEFLDYREAVGQHEITENVKMLYVENELNELFTLSFEIDKGSNNDPELSLAARYLNYLGTKSMSSEEFKKELFKLGCDFRINAFNDRTSLVVSGLDENMTEALNLVMERLKNLEPDRQALDRLKESILKSRSNQKQSERSIRWRLSNYAQHGPPNSQMKDFLTESELNSVQAKDLVKRISNITNYGQHIHYYGPRPAEKMISLVKNYISDELQSVPEEPEHKYLEVKEPVVYWVNYDKIQADISIYFKGKEFDKDRLAVSRLYNNYFGFGMSSVMFQELREAQGLAYSASAGYRTASELGDFDYFSGYMGTQVDKLPEALPAFLGLIEDMPKSEVGFEAAKQAILKNIQTERITGISRIYDYESAKDMGVDYDVREEIYNRTKELAYQDILEFQKEYVKDKDLAILVVGKKDRINFDALEKYGQVKELSLEEIFGY